MAADSRADRHDTTRGRGRLDRVRGRDRPEHSVRWEFDPDPDTLALVRAAVRYRLSEWGVAGDDAYGALLVVSELVTNAVEHAGSRLDLTLTRTGEVLRISVHDGSSESPRLRRPHPTAMRGRGLQIVDAVATRWGSTPDATGKTVWADVTPGTAW